MPQPRVLTVPGQLHHASSRLAGASTGQQPHGGGQLIAQLRQGPEDLGQVALLARLDPRLAFRLLRYVNSAAMACATRSPPSSTP